MNKNMTVFYRKLMNNKIDRVIEGEQSLKTYVQLTEEEAKLIYGFLITDYNPLVLDNLNYYQVVEENGQSTIKLKDEYKNMFNQFL